METNQKLIKRELDNIDIRLQHLRGYISKFPDDKKVIVVFSGGLDSVTTVARCMVDYNLEVFPVSFSRGQSNLNGERQSTNFFDTYFAERFPYKFHKTKYIDIDIPPDSIKKEMKKYSDQYGYPLRDNILALMALQYAVSLWAQFGRITTVLTGIVPEDTYSHSTLASMRSTTLMACLSSPFMDWNISSVNIDPHLYGDEGPYGKADEIRWCEQNDIPIYRSRTCNMPDVKHCGACNSCKKRHLAFERAGVEDKTEYENNNI